MVRVMNVVTCNILFLWLERFAAGKDCSYSKADMVWENTDQSRSYWI